MRQCTRLTPPFKRQKNPKFKSELHGAQVLGQARVQSETLTPNTERKREGEGRREAGRKGKGREEKRRERWRGAFSAVGMLHLLQKSGTVER